MLIFQGQSVVCFYIYILYRLSLHAYVFVSYTIHLASFHLKLSGISLYPSLSVFLSLSLFLITSHLFFPLKVTPNTSSYVAP